MRANRTAAGRTTSNGSGSSNTKELATDAAPQLSEKEQAAKALDELHRLNSAIIAQWHNKKHKPAPPPVQPLDPLNQPASTTTATATTTNTLPSPYIFPALTSPTSPSLHPYRHPLRFRTSFRNTILSCFKQRNWQETTSETEWDIHWAGKEWIRYILPRIHLQPWQRVNHFVTYYELTRKDLLIKNLKKARNALLKGAATSGGSGSATSVSNAQIASEYNFWPETFNLPSEYLLFTDTFKRVASSTGNTAGMSNSWIMKPIGSSQGKGIFLIDKLTQIADWNNALSFTNSNNNSNALSTPQQPPASTTTASPAAADGSDSGDSPVERYIVQRYLHNPLLIGGKKFDIRLYVLVTSYHPLTVYMHRSGFARFSSTRYTTVKGELSNTLVHLTNVAIQKHGDDYDAVSGGKWEVGSLRRYLLQLQDAWHEDTGATEDRVGACFSLITTLVIRSLQAVKPLMSTDTHCFELYGYDVLLDANYKPWLIEVNASPSLSANTPADEQLKIDMLHDVFHTLEVERWQKERNKRRAQYTHHTGHHGGGSSKVVQSSGANVLGGRVGGFDLLFDELGGGLRLDDMGRALCCVGLWNDRVSELQALWRRMAAMEAKDRELEAKHVAEMRDKRERQREKRKQALGT